MRLSFSCEQPKRMFRGYVQFSTYHERALQQRPDIRAKCIGFTHEVGKCQIFHSFPGGNTQSPIFWIIPYASYKKEPNPSSGAALQRALIASNEKCRTLACKSFLCIAMAAVCMLTDAARTVTLILLLVANRPAALSLSW